MAVLALALVLVAEVAAAAAAYVADPPDVTPAVRSEEAFSASPSAPGSVVFGAVGDIDGKSPDYPDIVAGVKRLANRGGMFFLALGDLGYTSDEPGWCSKIKAAFNATLVVAGNHDTTQTGPGDIDQFAISCPFNVNATLVPGPTYGYGKSYYFDYPRTSPLARFLLITPGIVSTQTAGEDYGSSGAEYAWVVDAINGARSAGIPWVVAGMHKLCIDAGSYGCEIGHALFDELVRLKVDLILQNHYHSYQRSKLLGLSANCTTIPSDGGFDADCIVAGGSSFTKGAGSVVVINGAGGESLYTVSLDGSDKELGYFETAMGDNGNTQNRSKGHGPVVVTLTATALTAVTALCPMGTGDPTTGECPSQASSTFQDGFTISTSAPPPALAAAVSFSPPSPAVADEVTFQGSASGGVPPYAFAWEFGDGGSGSGATVVHAFAQPGDYTVTLNVTDAASHSSVTEAHVAVLPSSVRPVTALHLQGIPGANGWYVSAVTVSLTATSPLSAPVTIAYRLDGGTWSSYAGPFGVGDGVHSLEYNATDSRGNAEATQTGWFKADASPPQVHVPASGRIETASTIAFSWNATDEVSGIAEASASVDGGPATVSAVPSTQTWTLSDGEHTVHVRAADQAGNAASAVVTFRIDTNPFSPTGPLLGIPTYALAAAVAGAVVYYLLRRRRQKRER